jgi:hypothetical protein
MTGKSKSSNTELTSYRAFAEEELAPITKTSPPAGASWQFDQYTRRTSH